MAYTDLISADYIAAAWQEAANASANDYLGASLFGFRKQSSLELKYLKGSGSVPISLAPAAFDAEVALRTRQGAQKIETEMPLFREGIQMTEQDTRDLMEAEARGDGYVQDILGKIFDDTNNLIKGAKVVPERMIWQLLAPADGSPAISIAANDVNYAYSYDPNGTWQASNFIDVSASPWSDSTASTPISDIQNAVTLAKSKGVILKYAIMSQATFNEMMASEQVKGAVLAQNATATIFMTEAVVKTVVEQLTGVKPIAYTEVYADESGNVKNFYPDSVVTLIPDGELGKTVYAVTNEEYNMSKVNNVAIVDNSIAITTVATSNVPVRIATYAAEIVLPSYERMDSVYEMKVDA